MAGWSLSLGIIGAVTGVLGVASGFYSFILSGYRVKIYLGFAILRNDGDHIEFGSNWNGDLGEFDSLILNNRSLQILIQARNSGRSKIVVKQLFTQNYRKKAKNEEHKYFTFVGPPIEGKTISHLLDFGASCSWLVPLEDIKILSSNTIQGKVVRNPIFAEIHLADGNKVFSKRKGITPEQVDVIEAKWEKYRNERI